MMTSIVKSLTPFLAFLCLSYLDSQSELLGLPAASFSVSVWKRQSSFLRPPLTHKALILPIWICHDSSKTPSTFPSQGQSRESSDVSPSAKSPSSYLMKAKDCFIRASFFMALSKLETV